MRLSAVALLIGLLAVSLLTAVAQSTSPEPAPAAQVESSGETLTVYSGRTENLIGPILERFSAETGIAVQVRYGNTAEMAAAILEEGDNSPADVYIAQDAGALGALADAGHLRPLASDILERVPAEFRSPGGLWVGLSGRARVLVYSTERVAADELPASLLDLTDPAWAGRLGWAPTNASLQSHVTALRQVLGEDAARAWLEGLIANGAIPYDNNRAVVQAVLDGEIDAGLVNHYYLLGFLSETPGLPAANYFFPDGDIGSLVNVAGAGVVASSDRPGLAQRLILYLLGAGAQHYFAEETFEYPLADDVAAPEGLPALASLETPAIDLSHLSDLQASLDLLSDTGALP